MDEFDGFVFYDTYEREYFGSGRHVALDNGHSLSVKKVQQPILSWEVID